jgi:hypothetical protein
MSNHPTGTRRSPAVLMLAGAALFALALVAGLATLSGTGTAASSATQYAPSNTAAPTISGTAQAGQTLTANEGTWTGDQPIVFTYQWQRCNAGGQSCVAIPNAKDKTYLVQATDVDNTLRVEVTGTNSQGSKTATSAATAKVVKAGENPDGAIKLPNGTTSVSASAVNPPERLVVDSVTFSPNPVRSRTSPITVKARVIDTRGYVVRDALVFIRSTPVVTDTPPEGRTAQDGTVTFTVNPQVDFPLKNGYSVQFFVRARKTGDNPLAGVSSRRLVQVRVAR